MNDTPTKGTAVMSNTPLRQVQSVKDLLFNENAKAQLQMVAAKHLDPARMMRVVANAIRTTPKLGQCEPMSFLGALMHCASMGLEPNTPLGHAYLIPFENKRKGVTEVQVVLGYKGLIELARRSGKLVNIHGDVVYSDDKLFSHEYGSNQHLRHVPGPHKGKVVAFYCYVELDLGDGATAKGHRVMSYEEVIAHRNQYSQGWKTAVKFGKQKDSPWYEENPAFEAMGIKTVIRRMAGRGELPMSIEFIEAEDVDERRVDYRALALDFEAGPQIQEEDEDQDAIEGQAEPAKGKSALDVGKENAARDAQKEQDQAKPKQGGEADTEEKKPPVATTKADDAEIAAQRAQLVEAILKDLVEAGRGQTKGVLEMYGDQMDIIHDADPDAWERINKRAYAVEAGEYEEGNAQ